MPVLKRAGSACFSNSVPSGMPRMPPSRKGQSSRQTIAVRKRQIEKIWIASPGIRRPAQERLEPRLALDGAREGPEMRRQEKRQQHPREAMGEEGPIGGVVARAPIDGLAHAKSASAARQPASMSAAPKTRI